MKNILLLFYFFIAFGCAKHTTIEDTIILSSDKEGEYITFSNRDISLKLDKHLQANISYNNKSITERTIDGLNYITIDGNHKVNFEIKNFPKKAISINDSVYGNGKRLSLLAFGKGKSGAKLKQNLTIEIYNRYKNLLVLNVSYTNIHDIKTIRIDSTITANLKLNASLTSPKNNSYDFHTFQGAARQWGLPYAALPITKDFKRTNFMGLYDRYRKVDGDEDEGGGINLIDVWNESTGIAISHLATKDIFVYFPTIVDSLGKVNIAMTEKPDASIGQTAVLKPNETYHVQAPVAIIAHEGDYYKPLETYKELLQNQGVVINETSYDYMYNSYWKTWGWRDKFTMEMIYERIPILLELGIEQVMVDAGWFENDKMGDWEPALDKYPNGDADVITSVKKMKELGIKRVYLWYNPLGAGVDSKVFANKDWIVMNKEGGPNSDILHSLCPAYPPVQEYIRQTVTKFISEWGYDGIYNDFAMNSVAPLCYNPVHKHEKPTDAFEATPEVFKIIWETAHKLHENPFIENCMCSLPHSLFKNAYTNLTSSSDPTETNQIRNRIKVEKATHGPSWPYNTYIEQGIAYGKTQTLEELDSYFATIIGTGTIPTSLMGELVPERFEYYKKWFQIYRREKFSDGEYLNLYDIVYDKPETHVNKKENIFYYGFYANSWDGELELRGLKEKTKYIAIDYVKGDTLGIVNSTTNKLTTNFKNYLLIKCVPAND